MQNLWKKVQNQSNILNLPFCSHINTILLKLLKSCFIYPLFVCLFFLQINFWLICSCRSDTATVTVTIIDLNDSPPVFEEPPDSISVPEDARVGYIVVTVTVSDYLYLLHFVGKREYFISLFSFEAHAVCCKRLWFWCFARGVPLEY